MSADIAAGGARITAEDARNAAEAARETAWERPSFAKGLYLGDFNIDLIHPHPVSSAADTERGELPGKGGSLCQDHGRKPD